MTTSRVIRLGRVGRSLVLATVVAGVIGVFALPASAKPFVTFQKTAGSGTIQAGDVASFTITATNIGTTAASNVVISDPLPGGLAWAENPDVAACSISAGVLACSVASLASGATLSVTVEAATDPAVCDYTLTNTATLTVNGRAVKTATASISVTCPPPSQGCTLTQGFWKTHFPDAWPADVLANGLTLGTVSYTAAQLEDILNQSVGGNGLISLAHQLITAKINIANGADDSAIASTITAADALIDGLVVPPVGSDFLAPSDTSALTDALDDFNEGLTGPGHCDD